MATHKPKQFGFTIVELLIVIVVIGILASITIVAYNGVQSRAKFTVIRSDLEGMQKIIEYYNATNGSYPNTSNAWQYRRRDGTSFIPGTVPAFTATLPDVGDPLSGGINDTYIYQSDGTGYRLMRLYQPNVLSSEWSQVPAVMRWSPYTDRWGVASPGWM